jgi:hypothetical protein
VLRPVRLVLGPRVKIRDTGHPPVTASGPVRESCGQLDFVELKKTYRIMYQPNDAGMTARHAKHAGSFRCAYPQARHRAPRASDIPSNLALRAHCSDWPIASILPCIGGRAPFAWVDAHFAFVPPPPASTVSFRLSVSRTSIGLSATATKELGERCSFVRSLVITLSETMAG